MAKKTPKRVAARSHDEKLGGLERNDASSFAKYHTPSRRIPQATTVAVSSSPRSTSPSKTLVNSLVVSRQTWTMPSLSTYFTPESVSALNVIAGVVAEIGPEQGPVVDVRLDCSGEMLVARLTRYSVAQLQLRPGAPVFALVKSVSFDRRSLSGLLRTGGADDGVVDA